MSNQAIAAECQLKLTYRVGTDPEPTLYPPHAICHKYTAHGAKGLNKVLVLPTSFQFGNRCRVFAVLVRE